MLGNLCNNSTTALNSTTVALRATPTAFQIFFWAIIYINYITYKEGKFRKTKNIQRKYTYCRILHILHILEVVIKAKYWKKKTTSRPKWNVDTKQRDEPRVVVQSWLHKSSWTHGLIAQWVWAELSSYGFRYYSGQLSITSSKNSSVVDTMCINLFHY